MKHFGYYLTLGSQAEMTRDHVTLFWTGIKPQWQSLDEVTKLTTSGKAVVLDVESSIFENRAIRPDAAERLRALRAHIAAHGNLSAIDMIVPVDEPNLKGVDLLHLLPEAIGLIRREWPGVKVGCTYQNTQRWDDMHLHLLDRVGFDDYPAGASIFDKPKWYEKIKLFFGGFVRRGSYLRLAERLRPDQQTYLIPGGSYGERPERWFNEAVARPEVWAVVPFMWASAADGSHRITGIADRDDVRDAYVAAGRSVMEG